MFRGTWKTISDKYSNKEVVTSIKVEDAKLCPDCDIIFAHNNHCTRCGSSNFYHLSHYLGGNLGSKSNRTYAPKMREL